MAKKKYEEFIKLPADKMAQTISDVTYMYKETEVPKAHYKKFLDEIIEEQMDQILTQSIVGVYVKTLKQMIDDSPQLFFKALMCIDKKVKPENMRPQEWNALEITSLEFMAKAKEYKGYLKKELQDLFDDIVENGLSDRAEFEIQIESKFKN